MEAPPSDTPGLDISLLVLALAGADVGGPCWQSALGLQGTDRD